MEGDAATQVERVGQSVGSDVPAFGEPRLDLGVRVEARESVEEIADGAAGGHVGRERGIERPRVVLVARVDDLVARRGAAGRASGDDTGEHASGEHRCRDESEKRADAFH